MRGLSECRLTTFLASVSLGGWEGLPVLSENNVGAEFKVQCSLSFLGLYRPWLPFFHFAAERLINEAFLLGNCSPSHINFIIFGIWNFSVVIFIKKSHTHKRRLVVSDTAFYCNKTLDFPLYIVAEILSLFFDFQRRHFIYDHNYPQSLHFRLV